MRELLAVAVEAAEFTGTATAAVTLALVSLVVIVPALLLCGLCSDSKPDHQPPAPSAHQSAAQHGPHRPPGAQHYSHGSHPWPANYAVLPHGPPHGVSPGAPHHAYPTPYPPGYLHNYPPGFTPPNQANLQSGVGYQGPPVPGHQPPGVPPAVHGAGPPLGPPGHVSASPQQSDGAVLNPRDTSLEAVEEVLHNMCTLMKGSVRPGKTLIKSSIRKGINAVIADASTNYAVDETILFFPDRNCKIRQMKLYEQLNLKDSMPLVSLDTDPFEQTDHDRSAMLPACIFVNRAKTLDSVVQNFATPQEKQQELFGIWQQLARLLRMFHQRGWYLRDVRYENVVFVRMGVSEGWTLLEFGNASKERKAIEKATVPPRTVTPELAEKMLTALGEKIHLSPAYDMWQLGILVYEVMTGSKYWPESMSDGDVLRAMADPRKPLPHEERPMGLDLVQKVMEHLMHRDPQERFSSADLIKRLEQDLATAGAVTLNPGDAIEEPDLVIES